MSKASRAHLLGTMVAVGMALLSAPATRAHAQTQPQLDGRPAAGKTQHGKLPPAHPTMIGMTIYSADGMVLGQVTGLERRGDGGLEAIEAELGSPLGLGATSVRISPGELRWRGDGVELPMTADQVRSVLQGQGQGQDQVQGGQGRKQ